MVLRGILHPLINKCVVFCEENMSISYKKLWKLLIDKDMNKTDLQKTAKISWASITRLTRGENIGTDILLRICQTLECNLSDIMEIEGENDKQ